ncbi:MAG TPA: chorismate synthase [Firmicutes bacterium]|nr:chorismate synthase [Bacillota bacterium]
MSSLWCKGISLSIFGESHGNGIGVVLDHLPSGEEIDPDQLAAFMARRAPRQNAASTARREKDQPRILSGILNGRTTGAPLCAVIENTDTRSQDYGNISALARPGHADYTGHLRYKGYNDVRGGGHFSGRLTAPLCFAGAVCGQILARRGIVSGAHIAALGEIRDTPYDSVSLDAETLLSVRGKSFPTLDTAAGEAMLQYIDAVRRELDSVGGIIECGIIGFPAGIGSPMFGGIENVIASIVFGIPAVKGIEFGAGFGVNGARGSQNNDPFYMENGMVKTRTNHAGGILGGISSGMPICFRVAVKPTPSIAQEQDTIDYRQRTDAKLTIHGRHDACVLPRAVPVVEAAANIALLGLLIEQNGLQ